MLKKLMRVLVAATVIFVTCLAIGVHSNKVTYYKILGVHVIKGATILDVKEIKH